MDDIRNPLAEDSARDTAEDTALLSGNPGRHRIVVTHREIALHMLENHGDAERVLNIITG